MSGCAITSSAGALYRVLQNTRESHGPALTESRLTARLDHGERRKGPWRGRRIQCKSGATSFRKRWSCLR